MTVRFFLRLLSCALIPGVSAIEPCRIEVVEKGTGWPVPLVELRTTHEARFVTDNAGRIAFDLPELMDRETFFEVRGHGYEVKADGFGIRGVRLTPRSGQTLKVEVERRIIAKRLGRLTGSGLFGESQKAGLENDWRDGPVTGSDSVQNAVYQGKLFWAWGDTAVAHYKLGIFDTTSATTALQPLASFEPPLRLKLDYFTDEKGRPRGVAKMPGAGPTWITAYVTLPDKTGTSRLVATYVKIRNHLEVYESGLCVWNDATARFDRLKVLWTKPDRKATPPPRPDGQPSLWKDANGKEWAYFGISLPTLRCPATFEAWQDPATWETLTPQESLPSAADGKPVKPHSGFHRVERFPEMLGHGFYAELREALRLWRTLVCRSPLSLRSVGQSGKSALTRQLYLLQSPSPSGLHPGRLSHPSF